MEDVMYGLIPNAKMDMLAEGAAGECIQED